MTEAQRSGIDIQALLATAKDKRPRMLSSNPIDSADPSQDPALMSIEVFGFKPVHPPIPDGNELVEFRRVRYVSQHPSMQELIVQGTTVYLPEGTEWKPIQRVYKALPKNPEPLRPQIPQETEYR